MAGFILVRRVRHCGRRMTEWDNEQMRSASLFIFLIWLSFLIRDRTSENEDKIKQPGGLPKAFPMISHFSFPLPALLRRAVVIRALLAWSITLLPPLGAFAQQPTAPKATSEVSENASWAFHYPADKFEPTAQLDLRGLNEKVAGQSGFIRLTPDGSGFTLGNGQPVRFSGGRQRAV